LDSEYFDKVRRTFAELLRGVLALHELGKVHGDLKPSNLLVTEAGRVVVLDFGLTVDAAPAPGGPVELRPHGTPLYMAPEQFLQEGVSQAADFYALGVMLYQAVVGVTPFSETPHRLVAAKLFSSIPPPRELLAEVPEDLSRLCSQLLKRDPSERAQGDGITSLLRKVGSPRLSPFRG
jgi:serine/threonine protein kinase